MKPFLKTLRTILAPGLALSSLLVGSAAEPPFRPPAVPLIAHDPYFSLWSFSDHLTDGWPRHWTGTPQALCGLARIDGTTYRLIGPYPERAPAAQQLSVDVQPTRTIYAFEAGGVALTLTFLSPLLPHDLDLVSRPVSYLTWDARATDKREHAVALYFDATAEIAVNTPDQKVVWAREKVDAMDALHIGTAEQPVLAKSGDNLRIDWGYFYLAVPPQGPTTTVIANAQAARDRFAADGTLPGADETQMPRPANQDWPALACAFDLGPVGRKPATRHVLLAYDDLYSVEYFGEKLRPWWRRDGLDANGLLRRAEADYADLTKQCAKFDEELMRDLRKRGGEDLARLGALAFRQCLAAHKLVFNQARQPLYFSKENFSNGCIGTVDVTYPSSPFFLLFNPTLLRAQLRPILLYAATDRWKFDFSPHDLGTYPQANGQVYGGGEKTEKDQMPVEECGNMLLMVAALARIEGDASFALGHIPVLGQWAGYLRQKGLDPENQLCTDDFAGHLAHNANLSLKAILAIAAHAQVAKTLGRSDDATTLRNLAETMARQWIEKDREGDHYKLAFDQPGTWSMKYNLVWDRLLKLKLFPPDVVRTELAFYLTKQNRYGLPLDNRKDYTKSDWLVWTATLAESRPDFNALLHPLYDFANESPSRVPFTDWYDTKTAKQVGFQARSVIGGIFIPMLDDDGVWKKWAKRAR
jgi:hypothetical protein